MCIRGIDLASVSTFVDCIIKLFLQCGIFFLFQLIIFYYNRQK